MATTVNNTMVKIETVTVGSGGSSSIQFNSIPQTYTDLYLVLSLRSTGTGTPYALMRFNSNASNYTNKRVTGDGSSTPSSGSPTSYIVLGVTDTTSQTTNIFSSHSIYISNYAGSNYKSVLSDNNSENNSTTAYIYMMAGAWANTSAISSISITEENSNNWAQYSTATLYGISATPNTSKASGGIIYQDATYMYHVFPYSSTFTPSTNLSCDYLVVAGGGGGGPQVGGAGGAGGLRAAASTSFSTGVSYTITVGAGGAGAGAYGSYGNSGGTSSISGTGFSTYSVTGGGGGGYHGATATAGQSGGSGGSPGGGNSNTAISAGSGNAGSYSPVEGYAGGTSLQNGTYYTGGGGGAGGAGGNASSGTAGVGGVGTDTYNSINFSSWLAATNTGSNYKLAGGGGGCSNSGSVGGAGGAGGGGNGSGPSDAGLTAGTTNTGGGGGASRDGTGAAGGSGLVIIRYAK
jgi:hypothetical protein